MKISSVYKAAFRNMWPALLCTVFILVGAGLAFGQAGTPEQAAKTFYKWYMHELNVPGSEGPSKAKLRPFISVRLAKWMNTKEYAEWDADYFIDAQDWGKKWGDNIAVSNVKVVGATATLRVTLTDPELNRTLDLKLLKEGGKWKIDRVKGKE
jgi:uncharacterized protein DUF3828